MASAYIPLSALSLPWLSRFLPVLTLVRLSNTSAPLSAAAPYKFSLSNAASFGGKKTRPRDVTRPLLHHCHARVIFAVETICLFLPSCFRRAWLAQHSVAFACSIDVVFLGILLVGYGWALQEGRASISLIPFEPEFSVQKFFLSLRRPMRIDGTFRRVLETV